jgi:hypothetical protein
MNLEELDFMPNKKKDHSNVPEKDAVKKLRERFEQRKSGIQPSSEMDEIVKNDPKGKEDALRKIAKPKREPDLDLP